MKLRQLIKVLGRECDSGIVTDFPVRGIACDSKKAGRDFVFVAIKGNANDGHRFIPEAVRAGAGAVIVNSDSRISAIRGVTLIAVPDTRFALAAMAAEFYGHPSRSIRVIGITGTNGKTTITYLLEAVLKASGFNPGVIGTVNCRFAGKVVDSKNTTPGPLDLQSLLRQMRDDGVTHCLMEVSSHALDQGRTAGIDFGAAIFTNLTRDHLDYHKDLETYFLAKSRLFSGLKKDSPAVINNDDLYSVRLAAMSTGRVVTYGIKQRSDYSAEEISFSRDSTSFIVKGPKNVLRLKTPLIGMHNVYNILAAASWALESGLKPEPFAAAVESFAAVPGRLERVGGARPVFVDYAHTEDALYNVINALRNVSRSKIVVVFGCGGERDKTKRPRMGEVATELADFVFITSDNPRSEDPEEIIRQIAAGVKKDNYRVVVDRAEAIRAALEYAGSDDIVLVAGKGHENYQVLKDRTVHFDDCEVVRQCLSSKNS